MVAQLQARPDQALLETLKDILQYATPAWLSLFSQLGGLNFLQAALEQHVSACRNHLLIALQQQQPASAAAAGAIGTSSSVGNLSVLSAGAGSGSGGGGYGGRAAAGERPAVADALAAAVECVQALVSRSGGEVLLLQQQPRWVWGFAGARRGGGPCATLAWSMLEDARRRQAACRPSILTLIDLLLHTFLILVTYRLTLSLAQGA